MTKNINYSSITKFIESEFEPLYDVLDNGILKFHSLTFEEKTNYLNSTLERVQLVKIKMEYLCSYFSFHDVDYDLWDYDDFVNMNSELTEMIKNLNFELHILNSNS